MITAWDIKQDPQIRTYIEKADEALAALGFTEHSYAHVTRAAHFAQKLLSDLGYPERTCELAWIAGYMHDIGNVINRIDHAQSGAVMAFRILREMDMAPENVAAVVTAIGNHDEGTGVPVNPIAAALILGDKTDVRRSRVRNHDLTAFDVHDRVNYSVEKSVLKINTDKTMLKLKLQIDPAISPVMDYFEIFLVRMTMCRKAAEALGLQFKLIINEQPII